jgi:TatA/E family protein of Tat protein translocase
MFNLGFPEMIVIGAAALLIFGPKRLPELAKSLGKGIRDFKKALEGGSAAEKESLPPGELTHQEK